MELDFETLTTPSIVRRILGTLNYRLRKIAKVLPGKESLHRDEQFLRIAEFKEDFLALGLPVISMDTKKKEPLGPYFRPGLLFSVEDVPVILECAISGSTTKAKNPAVPESVEEHIAEMTGKG